MFDWLLYPHKLREAIADLKAKGDFRPEGLGRLHKILFWLVFGAVILIALTLTNTLSGTHPDPDIEHKAKIITVSSIIFTLIACILARINVFNNWIKPYSHGKCITACVEESKFNYISSSSGSTIGWNIRYKYYINDVKHISIGILR